MAGGLIVEHLDGETLVYDTETDEAHCLSGASAAEFLAADDDVSRRDVIRRLALAGAAAAGGAALVKTIVAPAPALAQSPPACVGIPCLGQGDCTAPCECSSPTAGVCQPVSDRNLKHHLVPVEPQDVLAALGL